MADCYIFCDKTVTIIDKKVFFDTSLGFMLGLDLRSRDLDEDRERKEMANQLKN